MQLLKTIEDGRRQTLILKDQIMVAKQILKSAEGAENVEISTQEKRMKAYYEMAQKLATIQSEIAGAERELEGILGE